MALSREELEVERERLLKQVKDLEMLLDHRELGERKTLFVMLTYGFILSLTLIVHVVFTALGWTSPFQGGFLWFVGMFAVIYLIGFILHIGILWKRDVSVKARVSEEGIELDANTRGKE